MGFLLFQGGDFCPDLGEVLKGLGVTHVGELDLMQPPALRQCGVLFIIWFLVSELGRLDDDGGLPSWCYLWRC